VELPDVEAVKLAARGDADAFMALVHRYRAPLIAHLHGRTRIRDEAEDLAQDVFCKAWQYLPRLREPGAFAGWLFRIADNAVVTAGRKLRPAPLEADPDGMSHAEPLSDHSVDVHAAVADLSDEHRIVVSLRHFSGMSTDEVAQVLGIQAGTVRSRLSRAYAELRRRLANRAEV
jgi:RNA polymerase sigma-70 factor (ECF subfamily)